MVKFWGKSTTSVLDIIAPEKTRKVSKKKIKELPPNVVEAQRQCSKMKKDLRAKEKSEKPFNCSQCDKMLCTKCATEMINESSFTCLNCHKEFPSPSDLKKHEVKKGNNVPFTCSGCDKKSKTHLEKHEKQNTQ